MKTYEVFYRGELIAKVIDFEKGFDAILHDLNPEAEIVQVEGTKESGIYVNQQMDTVNDTVIGVVIEGLG